MLRRLRFLLNRRRFDSDLEEEMRLHRELRAQKLGDPQAAQRRFGNILRLREESRDAWGWTWLESVIQDLRYAARVLKGSPLFTAAAVLTLALGIGANAALFTLVNALLLKPLPVHDPSRLVQLSTDRAEVPTAFNYRALDAIAQRSKTLEGLFTWYGTNLFLDRNVDAKMVNGAVASGSAFQTLGLKPQVGRFFTPDDDADGAPLLVVLSDHFWQWKFNRDPHIIGKTILLDRHRFIIIGIAPKSFYGIAIGENPNFIITIHAKALLDPQHDILHETSNWFLPIFGRLKPGVSMQQANAELRVLSRPVFGAIVPPHLNSTDLREYFKQNLLVTSGAMGSQFVADRYRQPLLILISISGLVLFVAGVNIASLLLARAVVRSREISVRLAVGASRWRVIRQLLTESILLSILGALFGAFLAWCSLGLTGRLLPFMLDLTPDWRILAFLAALAVLTALVFGTAPAFAGTDLAANEVLKQGRAGSNRAKRLNGLLVCGQIALSLILLAGALLFIRTFENLKWQNLGFDPNNLLFINFEAGNPRIPASAMAEFYRQILARTASLPTVRSVSLTGAAPLVGTYSWTTLSPDLWPNLNKVERDIYTHVVSPGYFQTLRIPLLQGRDFNASDQTQSEPPPAVTTATAAHTYFPNLSPVGRVLKVDDKQSYRIVGVVRDAKFSSLRDPQSRAIYTDAMYAIGTDKSVFTHNMSDWTLAIRVQGNASPVLMAVRNFLKQTHKDIVITDDLFINNLIDQDLRTDQTMAILSAFFAAVTALLVALGLYGLLAYTVTRRTTEIGVRLALGASRKGVLWLILKEALLLTAFGILIGIPAVVMAGKLVSSMLYGISPSNPATLAICAFVMLAIAASAGLIPAWRAAKVDPATALRWE